MLFRRSPSRAVYSGLKLQKLPNVKLRRLRLLLCIGVFLAFLLIVSLFLRKLSCEIAMSDAVDAVTYAINDSVSRTMRAHDYDYDWFVTLDKDETGGITAITTNTQHINLLTAELLQDIVSSADNQELDIRIPLGNLLGSNLLLGKGPEIPVRIIMLTSSFVRFDNDLISTGINQSRHVITLKANVDIDILIPWATVSTTVESDVLIAETVIVGRVPETYVSVTEEKQNGSK